MTELNNRYSELYEWWFNPSNKHCWFDATESDDENICNLFGELIQIDWISKINLESLDFKQSIGFILANDQIIRHYVRTQIKLNNIVNSQVYIGYHFNIIKYFTKNFYVKNSNILNGHDFCFVLLPLRHEQSYSNIRYVLEETWEKISNTNNPELKQIYSKYLKATYQRSNINTISEYIYETGNVDKESYSMHKNIQYFIDKYEKVLDKKCFTYKYNDNYLKIQLEKLDISQGCLGIDFNTNLIVSISGGVDSMVLSWILKKLGFNIILVHINYSNRADISNKEEEFVLEWGSYLGVRTFYRRLDEINRQKCMDYDLRNLYEEYTRVKRFQTYVETAKIMGWDNFSIVMGHNHDDCIENIFTNIVSKGKWDNLYGMEFSSNITFNNMELNFIRPFLKVTKSQIYQFAFETNILFLWDSTPDWSQRGKIRDLVRPSLLKFNPEIITGLDSMVQTLNESIKCVEYMVDDWVGDRVGIKDQNLNLNNYIFKKTLDMNKLIKTNIFWNKLLLKLNIRISVGCLHALIERLFQIEINFNQMQINKNEKFQLNKNLQIKFCKDSDNKLVISI
jgi:tRNA(Ile)-lysidine synthetase-like protein